MNNQILPNLSHADYLARPEMSASGIKLLLRSPAHYAWAKANPSPGTPQQMLGTLTHAAVHEPDRYAKRLKAPAMDKRTKAGREAWAAFNAQVTPDALVVTEEQEALVTGMRDAVYGNEIARTLLEDGEAEVSAFFEVDGLPFKARFDWLAAGHDLIVDLKTAADASFEAFARSAGNFQYHLQDVLYRRAAKACGLGDRKMVFVVVENAPPHAVALYTLDDAALWAAEARLNHACDIYRTCLETGTWPSYSDEIQVLSLPSWSLK